ncbi:hypothetical protein [Vampirovibrio sp.]|uniref:hypothetical protein n=1 Tax=Vampirovibrio sp. TaxID=2717857 RepID=UPI0035943443
MTMILSSVKVCVALLIIGLIGFTDLSAQADNGSTQAVLSLVVLPDRNNLFPKQSTSRQRITPTHPADTRTGLLEKTGLITRQVWIAM